MQDDEAEHDAGDTFITQQSEVRRSLCRFLSRTRLTVTQLDQPERQSIAHGALSDTSSDDGAVDAAMGGHGDGIPGHNGEESAAAAAEAELAAHIDAHQDSDAEVEAAEQAAVIVPRPEAWQQLTQPARIPPGEERSPVYRCHNDFLAVRHSGRAHMQELLYGRAKGRCAARMQPALAAALYTSTTAYLDRHGGLSTASARNGCAPRNPFLRAKMYVDTGSVQAPVRRVPATLQLEDVQLLERFYNQLCLLVEAQKSSDPLSLIIVQMVRSQHISITVR